MSNWCHRHRTVTFLPDGLKPKRTLEQLSLEAVAKLIDNGTCTRETVFRLVAPKLHDRLTREIEWLALGKQDGYRPFWWWERAGAKVIDAHKRKHATTTKFGTSGNESVIMINPVTGELERRIYLVVQLPSIDVVGDVAGDADGDEANAAVADDDDDDDDDSDDDGNDDPEYPAAVRKLEQKGSKRAIDATMRANLRSHAGPHARPIKQHFDSKKQCKHGIPGGRYSARGASSAQGRRPQRSKK